MLAILFFRWAWGLGWGTIKNVSRRLEHFSLAFGSNARFFFFFFLISHKCYRFIVCGVDG